MTTEKTETTATEIIEQVLCDICFLAHRHEVQTWRDAPGTPDERLKNILELAREGLCAVRENKHV